MITKREVRSGVLPQHVFLETRLGAEPETLRTSVTDLLPRPTLTFEQMSGFNKTVALRAPDAEKLVDPQPLTTVEALLASVADVL